MEGPGGYQLVGRTIQMWNRWRATECFEPGKPWLLRFFDRASGGDQAPSDAAPRPDLAERLARAEEELARADEPTSIGSADEVPPMPGLSAESDKPGIASPAEGDSAGGPRR